MQKDQIELTISALANSARAEVLPVIFYLVDVARFDIKRPLLAAGRHNGGPLTHQLEESFQSNYACSLALMKKGVRMPLVSVDGDGLEIERDVAVNHQSTHMSQVNLVLKRHAERAEALVGKLAEDADAALCVTTELAQFCMSEDVATKQVELAETLVLSLELTRREEELCRDSRSADGIVPVASSLPAPGVLAEGEVSLGCVPSRPVGIRAEREPLPGVERTAMHASGLRIQDMRVTEEYLLHVLDEGLSDAGIFRVGLDVPRVRDKLAHVGLDVPEVLKKLTDIARTSETASGVSKEEYSFGKAVEKEYNPFSFLCWFLV